MGNTLEITEQILLGVAQRNAEKPAETLRDSSQGWSAAGNNNELVTGHQRHGADKNILLTNLLTDVATVCLSAICHSPR